jgi:hypothetical protein
MLHEQGFTMSTFYERTRFDKTYYRGQENRPQPQRLRRSMVLGVFPRVLKLRHIGKPFNDATTNNFYDSCRRPGGGSSTL